MSERKFLYKASEGSPFHVGGISGRAVTAQAGLDSGDVAIMEVSGRHGRCLSTLNDRWYVVVRGTGKFYVDKVTVTVIENDVVVVPKNTEYDFEGHMKIVMFNSPRFDADHDVLLEGSVQRGK